MLATLNPGKLIKDPIIADTNARQNLKTHNGAASLQIEKK